MAVYLDTNVLVQRSGLDSLELSTIQALCREASVDIVVPALVADEVESSRLRIVEAALDTLRAAHREASRYAQIPHMPDLPTPGEIARAYRERLKGALAIAATPNGAPAEALRREAFRLKPARGGGGARDTAIWLTVRNDHLQRAERSFLVTNNSRDFASPGAPSRLHPALAEEVGGHDYPLTLAPSLSVVVGALAQGADELVDEERLGALEGFRNAARRLLHEPDFVSGLRPPAELELSPEERLFVASDIGTCVTALREIHGYQIADRRVSIGRVAFECMFELGALEKRGAGRMQRSTPVECTMTALVWFGEDLGGGDPAVEISQVVSATVQAS